MARTARHRKAVLFCAIAASVLVGLGAGWVRLDNNMLGYFKASSDVRARTSTLSERLTGMQSFYAVLTADSPGAFHDPHFLKQVRSFQDAVRETGLFDGSYSLADYISLLNREMNGGGPEQFKIPDSPQLVKQYELLLRRSETEQYVSSDFRQAAVVVRHHLTASHDINQALEALKGRAQSLDKRLEVRFTGEQILTNKAADTMAGGQIASLATLGVVIFVMMWILFMDIKAGILSLLPNIVPITTLFGLMGYLRIPLDIGTALIADIVIGIAVDDTIHFMVRYNEEMRATADDAEALKRTMRSESNPVFTSTIALALGFAILVTSRFVPIIYFGALSALLMGIGLAADLVITPTLLSMTRFTTLWDVIAVKIGRQVLDDCPLFVGLKAWQVRKVVSLCQVKDVKAGERFIKQGETGKEMFVILEGRVRADKTGSDGRRLDLGSFGPGALLGELALVAAQARTADLHALADLKLLVLEWKALEGVAKALPRVSSQLYLNISKILGQRLLSKE